SQPLPDLHAALDGVHARRLHGAVAHDGRRARRLHARAVHARVPLHVHHGPARVGHGHLRGGAAGHAGLHRHAAAVGEDMNRGRHSRSLQIWLSVIAVVMLIWTLFPVYYMLLLSFTPASDTFKPDISGDSPPTAS